VFSGNYTHLIDPKGRVSVPSIFRELVQATGSAAVFLAPHPVTPPRFLEAYPVPAWLELEEKLLSLGRFDQTALKLQNFFVGQSYRCDIDNQGRVLIPTKLREWANLTKDVVFAGATDRFRIYEADAWSQALGDAEAAFKTSPELLSRLNL